MRFGYLVERVSPRTGLVVAQNVASMYRDEEMPEQASEDYFASAIEILAELATALSLPIVATDAGDDTYTDRLIEVADTMVDVEETRFGHKYSGPGVEDYGYYHRGAWQTTIPYWVDLFGAVDDLGVAPTVGGPTIAPGDIRG